MTSAYPKQLNELIEQAQRLCRELGTIPSQNKLKAALHVRAERARAVLRALQDSGFDPTDAAESRRLHVVPDAAQHDATASHTREADEFRALSGTLPLVAGGPPAKAIGQPAELVSPDASEPVPEQVTGTADTVPTKPRATADQTRQSARWWPVILLAAPAFVAIWSGWVGVGALTGFGPVHPLPGIASGFTINSAITLPIGVETYAAYALRVWLSGAGPDRAQRFAKRSAIAAFVLGGLGQIAYHLMTAAHLTVAPWPITTVVSCLPVVVLGFGAALGHLQYDRTEDQR
jgi:hypothetical protein